MNIFCSLFSCQIFEQWRSCSYCTLLFRHYSGDHDSYNNTTNTSVDIETQTITSNPNCYTKQRTHHSRGIDWHGSTEQHNFSLFSKWWSKLSYRVLLCSGYAVLTAGLWLHSLYYWLWLHCYCYSKFNANMKVRIPPDKHPMAWIFNWNLLCVTFQPTWGNTYY